MNAIVIKLGGAAGVSVAPVLADVAHLAAQGRPVILVHGTSAAADDLAGRVGIPVRHLTSPSGHVSRYTNPQMLELYVMAAAGGVNKALVAELQRMGCNALGLSGVDGRLLVARRKDAVRAIEGGRQRIVRDDYTGQIEAVNGALLELLLGAGITPVVAPLRSGLGGERLNVDGDRAAAMIAGASGADALVILSNVPGLLAEYPDEASLVRHVPAEHLHTVEHLAQGRMKKKLLAAKEALEQSVPTVVLADSRRAMPVRAALRARGPSSGSRVFWNAMVWCWPIMRPLPAGSRRSEMGVLMTEFKTPGVSETPGVYPQKASAVHGRWAQPILDTESAHTSGVYPKRPLAIVRGEGAHVWDADGNEYIDCVAGQGSANLGHCHPEIVAAVAEQASRLITCPEIFYNDVRAALLHRLSLVAPAGLDRAFLCNSGAEAVEAALEFARAATGRPGIVAARNGFHGRTMGSLSATWKEDYRRPFAPLVPGFTHVPFNDLAALEAAVGDETAAVILEPVQGEGGVHPARGEYLRAAAGLCRERGALLILDEVQTGFGRTGKLFACEHFGVTPDLLAVAKSMAGGLPSGACLIGSAVGKLPPMSHGSTFGGNPLTAAAALATINVMTSPYPAPTSAYTLVQHAARSGRLLMEGLRAIHSPLIREVRGLGLMVGIELKVKVTPVLQRLQSPVAGGPRAGPARGPDRAAPAPPARDQRRRLGPRRRSS